MNIHEKVISLIPSRSLKTAIGESNFEFPELDGDMREDYLAFREFLGLDKSL